MTTAPTTADFAKTVNAVGIGSSAWLERPALKPNKIKAFVSLKKMQINVDYGNRLTYSVCRSRAKSRKTRTNRKMKKYYVQMSKPESGLAILGGHETPEAAVADAKSNHAKPDRFGLLYEVSEELGAQIEDRGDCEDLCFKVLGEGKVVEL